MGRDFAGLLRAELANAAGAVAELKAHGFEPEAFIARAAAHLSGRTTSQVTGQVTPPLPEDIAELPRGDAERRALIELGLSVLAEGACALVVLAGGMATRMGGVVKALVPAVDDQRFLDLRLREVATLGARCPLWLMTSEATEAPLRRALQEEPGATLSANLSVSSFRQDLSLRFTSSGALLRGAEGELMSHAPGHGDLPDALARSGLLTHFMASGGRLVLITNVDNLGACLDPLLIGWHLSHGAEVSCEVVDKQGTDRGGVPVRLDGRPVILEELRLPASFDPSQVSVFNTNTFWVNAQALAALPQSEHRFSYFAVEKRHGERRFLQLERLLGEITSFLPTRFVRVPRDGAAARFLPVKDHDELIARQDTIRQVLAARRIWPA
ncbi:MAG: UTP--glucose-1-phosphate uridylyltransferase [Polyangiaceae bacterium]|nr:UTP--glucose-1-phosphate uridylyltransferase [Polyangiaceae bacterium]MCW5792104.1 UTP--glucose-1-phosphate uridylyltransferase [Polyangiaceae bacterium]